MNIRNFFKGDQGGPVTLEYVIFVAAIGIIMAVGVTVLFNAMTALFTAWAQYFGTAS